MAMTPAQKLARAAAEAEGLAGADNGDFSEANHREISRILTAMSVPDSLAGRAYRAVRIMAGAGGGELTESEQRALMECRADAVKLAEQALPTFRRAQRGAEIETLRAFHKQPDGHGLVSSAELTLMAEDTGDKPMGESLAALRYRVGDIVFQQLRAELREFKAAQAQIAELEAANAADLEPHEKAAAEAKTRKEALTAEYAKHTETRLKLERAAEIKAQREAEEKALREAEQERNRIDVDAIPRAERNLADYVAQRGGL